MQEHDNTQLIGAMVVDVETTMNCPTKGKESNPFYRGNKIVAIGDRDALKHDGRNNALILSSSRHHIGLSWPYNPDTMLIAHNAAFDMHYMMCCEEYPQRMLDPHKFALSGSLWDTQLAEYLLEAQQQPYPSLDFCASKRGGTLKDNYVSDFFKRGEGADKVPEDKLLEYLSNDVGNTYTVFSSQFQEASSRGMLPLIYSQMEARLATIDMGWNGIKIDWNFLVGKKSYLEACIGLLKTKLKINVTSYRVDGIWFEKVVELDLTSPKQLALWLYGGKKELVEIVPNGAYKNGNPKQEKIKISINLPSALYKSALYKNIIQSKDNSQSDSVDDKVLQDLLSKSDVDLLVKNCIAEVIEYRAKSKELSTYVNGIMDATMPDGFVHPNLNHCVARTGRLTSSNPNFQNISSGDKSDIKKAFVSRWGGNGRIVEMDYGQLEIVVLAVLSQDKQLLQDIADGADIHTALFIDMYHTPPSYQQRKDFKPRTFQLVYGAGAKGIAEQGGIDIKEARLFITTFYTRYPGVREWHDKIKQEVTQNRIYSGEKDKNGMPIGESCITGFSGRHYLFKEYVSDFKPQPGWDITQFSQSELKNYPVQGTATGDIVPLVLGKLYRNLHANPKLHNKCLLINTIHDSVLFDMHVDVLDEAIPFCKTIMESAPKYIKETWNFDFNASLKVGVTVGLNWFDQTEWESK